MKKLLLNLFVISSLLLCFTACENSEPNALNGTTWTETNPVVTQTLKFTSNTAVTLTATDENRTESVSGTYIYNAPKLKLTIINDGKTFESVGTVNGNKMIITDQGITYTFTKE